MRECVRASARGRAGEIRIVINGTPESEQKGKKKKMLLRQSRDIKVPGKMSRTTAAAPIGHTRAGVSTCAGVKKGLTYSTRHFFSAPNGVSLEKSEKQ